MMMVSYNYLRVFIFDDNSFIGFDKLAKCRKLDSESTPAEELLPTDFSDNDYSMYEIQDFRF
jgi:hypothetical protein